MNDYKSSSEILPPIIKDDKELISGISFNKEKNIISIHYHTRLINETDKEKIRNPPDSQVITLPIECLKWLAPRLEGYRTMLNIESGYK